MNEFMEIEQAAIEFDGFKPKGSFPLFMDALLKDTIGWDDCERFRYMRVLEQMFREGGYIPDDDAYLAEAAGVNRARNWRVKLKKLRYILIKSQKKLGFLTNKRVLKELGRAFRRSKLAQKGGKAKAAKDGARSMPPVVPPNPNPGSGKEKEEAKASKKKKTPKETPLLPNLDSRGKNAKPAKPRKRKTGISEDWQPDEQDHAFAAKKGNSESQITTLADKFRNHHVARATTFINWNAAWRTWVNNDIEFHGQPESRNAQSKRGLGNSQGGNKGFAAYAAEVAAEFQGAGLEPKTDGIYGNRGGDIHSDIKFGSDNGPVTTENTGPGVDEIGNVDQAKRQRH